MPFIEKMVSGGRAVSRRCPLGACQLVEPAYARRMKANRLRWFLLLFLLGAVFQSPAQQSEAERKLLANILAKAERGDAQFQFEVGRVFHSGRLGMAKDYVEAVEWYRKAAELNYLGAQNDLGLCYEHGQGVPKDYVEAVRWYRQAAEQNYPLAQNNLAGCYHTGEGVAKDDAEAVKWFRKAAEQNNGWAQYNLGNRYSFGEGVVKDEVEAVKWFRKAAEQNFAEAQCNLGRCYHTGEGVAKDEVEAVRWYRKAAEQNYALAQYNLGRCLYAGKGVAKDYKEAVRWFRRAAEQNYGWAQCNLGLCYYRGEGVAKDYNEAMNWYRKAAAQNDATAQYNLGVYYGMGQGVAKDYVEAYKWSLLAAGQGYENARNNVTALENAMSREQIAEGQRLARNFKPREAPAFGFESSAPPAVGYSPEISGTGFFITEDGFVITDEHMASNGTLVRLVTEAGMLFAKVVKVDTANGLALLKVEGKFSALAVMSSRTTKMGSTVATVGFPNIGLQGFAPKLAKGEIAALSGAQDDPRYFQISVPVQPGNSGGALVDERGNVVGVVSAKLNAAATLATSGSLPENVNYAVKSSFLLSFLESVPDVSAKLKEPSTKECKFENVVKSTEKASVLVLVY
jgi:TPR repeat protein